MARNEIEASLRLAVARCAEHEAEECLVLVSLSSRREDGSHRYDCSLAHDPVKIGRVKRKLETVLAGTMAGFERLHGMLPTCVMVFHIVGRVTVDDLLTAIMKSVNESADLPQPSDIGDVTVWYQRLRRPNDEEVSGTSAT